MQPKFNCTLFTQVKDTIKAVLKSRNDCYKKALKRANVSVSTLTGDSKRGKTSVIIDSDSE